MNPWYQAAEGAIAALRYDGTEDFTILCQGVAYKVHSFVLSMHSPVLAKICRGAFQESRMKVIDLQEDDKDAVSAMIDYFYTGKYTSEDWPPSGEPYTSLAHWLPRFTKSVALFILCDKLDIPYLKLRVTQFFSADWVGIDYYLLPKTKGFITLVVAAASAIYAVPTVTKDLRTSLANHVAESKHWKENYAQFEGVVEHELFAYDVACAVQRGNNFLQDRVKNMVDKD